MKYIANYPTGGSGGAGPALQGSGTFIQSTGTVQFSNANGVTFGLTNGVMTASVPAVGGAQTGISGLSGGTTQMTSGTAVFSNSNGISFGVNGNTITASYNSTQFQSTGNYLTTAAQSNQVVNSLNGSTGQISLNVGSSLSASSNGSSITFGLASNITTALQSAGAYLTTAMQSNAATLSNIRVSGGTTSNLLSAITFSDSNGVSFGLNAGTMTATVKTDYQSSNANYLTSQSNQAFSASGGSSAFQTLNFANSNGITFSNSNGSVIASHNGLTTARASTDAVGLNTAQSNVTWTVNSSGLSLDARGYAGTASAFSGTNVSATMTHNSAGFSLQLSAAAVGGGGVAVSAGGSNFTSGTVTFGNTNGVSFITTNGSVALSFSTAPAGSLFFGSSNGVTFGTAVAGASTTVTASVAAGAGAAFKGSGTYTQNSGTIEFANSNGITFGLSNNGTMTASHNGITTAMASNAGSLFLNTGTTGATNASVTLQSNGLSISVGNYITTAMLSNAATISNINVSGGTTSSNLSALNFVNSNGVSWSLDTASKIYATVATNYQSQGAYLTTARASNDAIGLNTALTAGPLAWTVNSNGISLNAGSAAGTTSGFGGNLISGSMTHNTAGLNLSLNHPAWLTTAMQSNAATISNINVSGGTTSSNMSAINFVNSNGVSWSLDTASKVYATVATNYQSQGAYLTTAMASNRGSDFMGTNTALTANGVSMTANSSGLSLNFPAFLTTAQSPGAYLTTAMVSNAGSNFVGLNSAITANGVSMTNNSSGLSLNFPAFLTTAMQSASSSVFAKTGFATTTTNGSVVVGTHNTAGMTLAVPPYLTTAQAPGAYLTTAMQSGSQSQLWIMGNSSASIGGTNISGTMFSNGMSLSVAAPGAGGNTMTVSAANGTFQSNAITFANSNGVSFSTGTQGVYATVATNYLTTAMVSNAGSNFIGLNTAGTNITWTANSSGISINNSGYAGIGFTGTRATATFNSNGLQLNIGPAQNKITLVGIFDGAGSAVASGSKFYIACPYAGTISAYSIIVDTGTCTVTTWKKAAGTAIPTVADTISTSGVAISSGTVVRSTTVTDFTSTTVTANDILAFNISAVSAATKIIFELEITIA